MTDDDRPEFAAVLHVLGETFNEPVSELRAEAYFDALCEFSLEQVTLAARVAIRVGEFFPRPSKLRELIEGDPEANADAAWAALIRQVQRVGYLGRPTFEDPMVLRAICDVWGGWRQLCETLPAEGPELVGWIKQFKAVFRSAERSEQVLTIAALPSALRDTLREIAEGKTMGPRVRLLEAAEPEP